MTYDDEMNRAAHAATCGRTVRALNHLTAARAIATLRATTASQRGYTDLAKRWQCRLAWASACTREVRNV